MNSAAAWAVGGGALVVVGLGVAVAVLGIQLGRARAAHAAAAADLAAARGRETARTDERDRALAELDDQRARTAGQVAALRERAEKATKLAAQHLPPEVLRERFRDLLEGDG